jgi:hypothetical protein
MAAAVAPRRRSAPGRSHGCSSLACSPVQQPKLSQVAGMLPPRSTPSILARPRDPLIPCFLFCSDPRRDLPPARFVSRGSPRSLSTPETPMALAIDGLLRLPCVLVLLWRCTGGDVVVLVGCCGGGTAAVPDYPTASTPAGRRCSCNPRRRPFVYTTL